MSNPFAALMGETDMDNDPVVKKQQQAQRTAPASNNNQGGKKNKRSTVGTNMANNQARTGRLVCLV